MTLESLPTAWGLILISNHFFIIEMISWQRSKLNFVEHFRGEFTRCRNRVLRRVTAQRPINLKNFSFLRIFKNFRSSSKKSVCLGIKYFEDFYYLVYFSEPSHISGSNMEIFSDMIYQAKYGNANQKSHLSVFVEENVQFSIFLSKPWFFLSRFLDFKNFVLVTGQIDSRMSKNFKLVSI